MASLEEKLAELEQLEAGIPPAAPAEQGMSTFDKIMGNLRSGFHELTVGAGDEIVGGLAAAADYLTDRTPGTQSLGQLYGAYRDKERSKIKDFAEKKPTQAMASGVVGALLPAVATMGAAAPASMARAAGSYVSRPKAMPGFLGRAAAGGMFGAGYGSMYGFNTGEGGAESRAENMAGPAALGAGVGAALPLVGTVARPIASKIRKNRAARKGGIPVQAVDPLQEGLEEATHGGSIAPAVTDGMRNVDVAPELGARAAGAMERLGRFGNPAREELSRRADEAGTKVYGQLDDAMGVPQDLRAKVNELKKVAGPKIKAAYDKAYKTELDYEGTEAGNAIRQIIDEDLIPPEAIREARKLMRAEGRKSKEQIAQIVGDDENAEVIWREMPGVAELDYITRAMNAIGEASKKIDSDKMSPYGAAVTKTAGRIREHLSDAVPAWKTAKDLVTPAMMEEEMHKVGVKAISGAMTRGQLDDEIAKRMKRNPEIASMVKPAVAAGMRAKIDETVQNAKRAVSPELTKTGFTTRASLSDPTAVKTIRDLSSPAAREKIESVVGPEKAKEMFQEMDEAFTALGTNEIVGDNLRKQAEKSLMENTFIGNTVGEKLERGNATGAAVSAVKSAMRGFAPHGPDENAAAVLDALMRPANKKRLQAIMSAGHKNERGVKDAIKAERVAKQAGVRGGQTINSWLFDGE